MSGLWLHSRRFDLFWYGAVPILMAVVMLSASWAIGAKGPVMVYMASSMITGLPHNMISWLLLLPRESREYYARGVFFGPFVLSAIVMIPTVLLIGTPYFAWAASINIAIAFFHITRQHQGLLNVADGRYIQATGDISVRTYTRDLRWLIGALAAGGFAWKLTGGPLVLGFDNPVNFSFYPAPFWVPYPLTALMVFFAGRFLWNTWKRHRAGQTFTSAHALLGGAALGNLTLAAALPNDQFFLSLALIAAYHNYQYFAFCFTHHRQRAVADPGPQDFYTRWARDNRFAAWFVLPTVLGVVFGVLTVLVPQPYGAIAANWFMMSHYFIDAAMWRRKYYPRMGEFGGKRLEATATVPAAPAPTPDPTVAAR